MFAHEVLLQRQHASVGDESRPHRIVGHRHHVRLQAEPSAQLERGFREGRAAAQHLRAQDVCSEVFVSDAEPGLLAHLAQRVKRVERLVLLSVAGSLVEHTREPVDDRVDVRADQQPPELVIVGRVGDHGEIAGGKDHIKSRGQLCPAGAAGDDRDLQQNRSSPAGRTTSRPAPGSPTPSNPRITTTGARLVLPITRPAAAARSSATASTVAWRLLPSSSKVPRRSRTAGTPASPSATLTMPNRHGRPNVSEMTTPTFTPASSRSRSHRRRALASGSSGSSVTTSSPGTLEWSTPPLAETNPWRVSVMRIRSERTTRALSSSTICTKRGSGAAIRSGAMRSASALAVTSERRRKRPSALETTFCATTTTSPSTSDAWDSISCARSSPG